MEELTPRRIVEELDRYIVGQAEAKRAVAIALRNRWRRKQLDEEMKREVTPKNILMIGPTGVGKTEIARRLATLLHAPFTKIEATKYTEVGYHGRDVESMVRDLVEAAIRLLKEEERLRVRPEAERLANRKLLDLLLPSRSKKNSPFDDEELAEMEAPEEEATSKSTARKRSKEWMQKKLEAGELEDRIVRLRVEQKAMPVQILSNAGLEQVDADLGNFFEKFLPKETKQREVTVAEARKILIEQETEKLIDRDAVGDRAVRLAEDSGIIFIDELDKVCGPSSSHGPDVSRQGVQRDLLPIVEGTTVQTRYGTVHTEHILFIAAGAFHVSKPSDLMPELQGRFPIRVELSELKHEDFVRILKEPKNSLIRQYRELLATEKFQVEFTDDALEAVAEIAHRVNQTTENIGARRLHTILEKLLEDLSFDASEQPGKEFKIDGTYVRKRLSSIAKDEDLSRFIL